MITSKLIIPQSSYWLSTTYYNFWGKTTISNETILKNFSVISKDFEWKVISKMVISNLFLKIL
jgi:hypothetical protein